MIETEFRFFQVQIKSMFVQPVKLCEAAFGITPEALYAVDMALTKREFVSAVIDTVMLGIAHIHQAVIGAHPV